MVKGIMPVMAGESTGPAPIGPRSPTGRCHRRTACRALKVIPRDALLDVMDRDATRRRFLGLAGGATAGSMASTLAGCLGSPYGFEGGRGEVQRSIADRLTAETAYDYVPDDDGQEDPPNEVYVGWRNGTLNVSIDGPDGLSSTFCEGRYWNRTLQQNGTLMDHAEDEELARLRAAEPALDDAVAIGFLTAMERARPPEDRDFPLEFTIDLANGSVTYSDGDPDALFDEATASADVRRVVLDRFWREARIDCGAASAPRPPGDPDG